jgi:hypothetical protein
MSMFFGGKGVHVPANPTRRTHLVSTKTGDVYRFDFARGYFGIRAPNGTIRTYFRPRDIDTYFKSIRDQIEAGDI